MPSSVMPAADDETDSAQSEIRRSCRSRFRGPSPRVPTSSKSQRHRTKQTSNGQIPSARLHTLPTARSCEISGLEEAARGNY